VYQRDVKAIRDFIDNDYDKGLERVVTFVIGSIRERFYNIERVTEDLLLNKENSKSAWGNRKKALISFNELKTTLKHLDNLPLEEATKELTKINGLGVVKASFVLQLMGRDTACLDVHNLTRLGISNTYFKGNKRINEYIDLVQQKGTEYWWNTWCELIADKYPKHFKDADEVSFIHAKAITGEYYETM